MRQRAEQRNVCASEEKLGKKSSYKANKEELVRGGSLGPPLAAPKLSWPLFARFSHAVSQFTGFEPSPGLTGCKNFSLFSLVSEGQGSGEFFIPNTS